MSKPKFLARFGDTYYFRRPVPKMVQPVIGKNIWKISLKTKDYNTAVQKVAVLTAEKEVEIANAKKEQKSVCGSQEIKHLVKLWFLERNEENAADDQKTLQQLKSSDELSEYVENIGLDITAFDAPETWNNLSRHKWASKRAKKLIQRYGLNLPEGHERFDEMVYEILRADKELLLRSYDRLALKDNTDRYHDSYYAQTPYHTSHTLIEKKDVETLSELISEHLKVSNNANPKTIKSYRAKYNVLEGLLGKDTPLVHITHKRMNDVSERLMEYPAKAASKYKHLSVGDAIKQCKSDGEQTISGDTHSKYISQYSALFKFGVSLNYMDINPAAYLSKAKLETSDADKRHPFSIEQLNWISANMISFGWGTKRNNRPSPHCIYIPLVALFAGLRLREATQLYVDDIMAEDGIWYFNITKANSVESGEDKKSLKTKNAKRKVPIHSKLEELGLLTIYKKSKAKNKLRLFYDVPMSNDCKRIGRWFNENIADIKDSEKGTSFHCFRHNFRSELQNSGVPSTMACELGGWEKGEGTSALYGDGYNLKNRKEAIEKIRYDGLNLKPVEEFLKCHSK